jgi:hypothetical protein
VSFYAFPADVRRILYTTNAIEALKLLFLVLNRSEKELIMPPRGWCMAKAQFAILFGERFTSAHWPHHVKPPAVHEIPDSPPPSRRRRSHRPRRSRSIGRT